MLERLYRAKSGVVFDDTFPNLRKDYVVNDFNHTEITADGLQITHSQARDVHVLRDIPSVAGAVEVFIDYTPRAEHDQGGFMLFDGSDSTAQLLEYADENVGHLENIKILKKDDTFDLFMKHDEFLHVDSVTYPFTKFGFIAKRGQASFEPLLIRRFLCTTSSDFIVKNLVEGDVVELETATKTFSGTAGMDGQVIFVFDHLVQDGTLRIKDAADIVLSELEESFFGGDEWCFGSYLIMRKNGAPLVVLSETELGHLSANAPVKLQLELHNPSEMTAVNLVLNVKKHNDLFGSEWVTIAHDNDGDEGVYSEQLLFLELLPDETIVFWLKLERTAIQTNEALLYFDIEIKHE